MTTVPASQQIRVRQCTVRVRRSGGWSWGDPAAYVDAAVAAVEQALEALVAAAGLDEATDLAVTAPLTLEIGSDGRPTPASLSTAAGVLRAAAAAARSVAARDTPPEGHADRPRAPAGADERRWWSTTTQVVALAGTLARWSSSGTLKSVLATWPPAVLDAWVAAVHAGARGSRGTDRGARLLPVIASIAGAVLAGPPGPGEDDSRRRFLLLTGAVAAALGGHSLPEPGDAGRHGRRRRPATRSRVVGDRARDRRQTAPTSGRRKRRPPLRPRPRRTRRALPSSRLCRSWCSCSCTAWGTSTRRPLRWQRPASLPPPRPSPPLRRARYWTRPSTGGGAPRTSGGRWSSRPAWPPTRSTRR